MENNSNKEAFKKLDINQGSKIYFFKNGKCLGLAYENIPQGFYFAGVSLYMKGKAKINLGKSFEYPPNLSTIPVELRKFQPYSKILYLQRFYEEV